MSMNKHFNERIHYKDTIYASSAVAAAAGADD